MIFELSRENIKLARAEVEALANKKGKLYNNLLILNTDFDFSRLAYTNRVFQFLFTCKESELKNKFKKYDWKKIYKKNFCIRSNKTKHEKPLAKYVWQAVNRPKVKLKNSDTEINILIQKNKAFIGKLIHTRTEKFQKRRPDLRPGFFPVSLKPKLARAIVNLSGVKKGTIWDPFCGTGGILIEAHLMGLKVIGSDIDRKMIAAAKKNFQFYKIKGKLTVADATRVNYKADAVVTDPPYGKRASLHKREIEKLYKDFLKNCKTKKIIFLAPNNLKIKNKKLIAKEYIHKNLTRMIYLLEK